MGCASRGDGRVGDGSVGVVVTNRLGKVTHECQGTVPIVQSSRNYTLHLHVQLYFF